MNTSRTIYGGGPIFDGEALHECYALCVENGQITALGPEEKIGRDGTYVDLGGDILSPGYVDLQVNGGDGIMFNEAPTVETLARIATAHQRLGVTTILPTLITDTADKTAAAIEAAKNAIAERVHGIGGLHLEGPHLSVARKGAHDAALIRPMTDDDLAVLIRAAGDLPVLMVTIAPENATIEQVRALVDAGALVSLGHSDANFDTCVSYADAGARAVTHLFNAMSQLGNREPGLVGAALASGSLSAGLIADGIHVHQETMRAAWAAKRMPGRIFLVSDAMAPAGSDISEFTLGGRRITRDGGQLALEDGTLAGADLDLTTAVRNMVQKVGVGLADALQAATSVPARLAGMPAKVGSISVGNAAGLIRVRSDLSGLVPLKYLSIDDHMISVN
ncbi:MAG: N-acetylglucosamine-6-phosphate deacetylase [Boseongicola sp.]